MRYFLSMANIDDKTKIPLYAVIIALPSLAGGILWLSSIDAKASSARDDLQGLKPLVIDIRERQIRLEQMVQDLQTHDLRSHK